MRIIFNFWEEKKNYNHGLQIEVGTYGVFCLVVVHI